jgi:hypothetical protein
MKEKKTNKQTRDVSRERGTSLYEEFEWPFDIRSTEFLAENVKRSVAIDVGNVHIHFGMFQETNENSRGSR